MTVIKFDSNQLRACAEKPTHRFQLTHAFMLTHAPSQWRISSAKNTCNLKKINQSVTDILSNSTAEFLD